MSLLFWLLVFVGILAVRVYGAGVFNRAAEAVGLRFGFSPFVRGVTIVAIGRIGHSSCVLARGPGMN